MTETDTAIIGAGPIGLELAVALKRAGVEYLQFEAGPIGQTVARFPKLTPFFSSPERIAIAGVPLQTTDQSKASREEYLTYLRAVVMQFDLTVHTHEPVTHVDRNGEGFTLYTLRNGVRRQYLAKHLVLAVGGTAKPRLLRVPGEDLPHVSHYFDEAHPYFHKRLLIVGGKNSAVEAAIRCYRVGARVTMSYRRREFDHHRVKYWLLPEIQYLIRAGRIDFYPDTIPTAIRPTHVTLGPTTGTSGEPVDVAADFVLLLTGYVMDHTLFKTLDVPLQGPNQAPVFDPQTMQTKVPGLYVAGTAAAGTQDHYKLFIENCHVHVDRIVSSVTGSQPPSAPPYRPTPGDLPES